MPKLSKYFETTRDADGVFRMHVTLDGYALLRLALTNKGTRVHDGGAPRAAARRAPAAARLHPRAAARAHVRRLRPRSRRDLQNTRICARCRSATRSSSTRSSSGTCRRCCRSSTRRPSARRSATPPHLPDARAASRSRRTTSTARARCFDNCPYDDVRMIVATDSSAILGIGDQGYGGLAIPHRQARALHRGRHVSPWRSLPVGARRRHRSHRPPRGPALPRRAPEAPPRRRVLRVHRSVRRRGARALSARRPPVGRPLEGLRVRRARALPKAPPVLQRRHPGHRRGGARRRARRVQAARRAAARSAHRRVRRRRRRRGRRVGARARHDGAKGSTEREAMDRMFVLDSKGLLAEGPRDGGLQEAVRASRATVLASVGTSLLEIVERAKPTVLLGLSGQPGTFTEADRPRDGQEHRASRSSSRSRTRRPRARRSPRTSSRGRRAARSSRRAARFRRSASAASSTRSARATTRSSSPASASARSSREAREITDAMVIAAALRARRLHRRAAPRERPHLPAGRRAARGLGARRRPRHRASVRRRRRPQPRTS